VDCIGSHRIHCLRQVCPIARIGKSRNSLEGSWRFLSAAGDIGQQSGDGNANNLAVALPVTRLELMDCGNVAAD
jgi:hypothetical protein